MIIGLDGIPLTIPKTGVGHYTFELACAMAEAAPSDQFLLIAPANMSALRIPEGNCPDNLSCLSVDVGFISRRWWSIGLPRYIRRSTIDLFHGTNYEIPLQQPCPTVLTIHDLSLLSLPEKQHWRRNARARVRLPMMARAADLVIVPSEAIRTEVLERLNLSSEEVFAIPEAAREFFKPASADEVAETKARFKLSDYIFTVGTIEPRKNYLMLLEAFERLLISRPDLRLQLVIAGGKGWRSEIFFERLNASAVTDRVVLTGYLNDTELRALYSGCAVSVYPSEYEGFGLPLLEAMACGAPVVASDIPSIVETVGSAARLVSPFDAEAWAKTLAELFDDQRIRSSLREAGLKRAAQFSWKTVAASTLVIYEQALKLHRTKK